MRKAVANLAYLLGITMILNSIQPVISGINMLTIYIKTL
jgi:MATE family multidrug resistance protein